ncbi:MAG: hypothetical protein D6780_01555 [Candidatus Dadabacteria bacterium]|nr:MAG: hypothetical protein D6780_01555 [Candidatus Dadabacteria bacterium]
MSYITSIEIALPGYQYSKAEILEAGREWLRGTEVEALFCKFVESAKINKRYFALPLDHILSLNGLGERSNVFAKEGLKLSAQAVASALKFRRIAPSDVDALIFTSCSVPIIPTLDVLLINNLGFRNDLFRLPIYQYGCAGGIAGLALADKVVKSKKRALLVSVEVCSLLYQKKDFSISNLVGSALFGDGAAAVVISREADEGLEILKTESYLIPNSSHLMGYDIKDDGFHLLLDKELPSELSLCAPKIVNNFLKSCNLSSDDIHCWLLHPGGIKVLRSLIKALDISKEKTEPAWNVLASYGNMSSASILFALSEFMKNFSYKKGDLVLMVGIGPGLTVELILMRCTCDKYGVK